MMTDEEKEARKKQLKEEIDSLKSALASGVFKISHRGKTIENYSAKEVKSILDMLETEYSALNGRRRSLFAQGSFYRA